MFDKSQKTEAPILKMVHLQNCKVLPQRFNLLQKLPKNAVGAEIGVLGGDWSAKLIKHTEPEKLILIDTFCSNDYPHHNRFTKKTHFDFIKKRFEEHSFVECVQGISWDCMKVYPENYFDWIYIDAAHDYGSVKKDLKEAIKVLKRNGIIILNDYIMYDHFTKEEYGVVQATNEFLIENDYEMLYLALHPNMFCDLLIKKRVV